MPAPLPGPPAHHHPHGRRVIEGNCNWIDPTDDYTHDMLKLQRSDRFAWNGLSDQIEESTEPGGLRRRRVEPGDYQCPLKFAPPGIDDPPWIGELKANGVAKFPRPAPMWRLYFGEPINRRSAVIGIRTIRKYSNARQKRDVREAMLLLKAHFSALGHLWASFPDRP